MKINLKKLLPFLFLFCFSTSFTYGQSKFEYGIGLSINHSKIEDDVRTSVGTAENMNKGIRLLALSTRLGYKFSDRFHLNSGIGVSWLGSLSNDNSARIIATTLEIPLQLEYNPWKNIQISSGPVYNYVLGIQSEVDEQQFDRLPLINSRHQLGLRHTIGYTYERIELSLGFTHYMTDVFNLELLNENGSSVGSVVSTFRNIQIGVVYRI